MFETPILFLVFNRPLETSKVYEQILKINPRYLYVAADGPRIEISGEVEKCNEVRNIITATKRDGELFTLFREQNLGCKRAVSSAIEWFFANVEQGIIIEDDCFPDLSFFSYAESLLIRYKNNQQIFSISGHNLGFRNKSSQSYGFSRYMNMWGWATWKRSAMLVDYEMQDWKNKSTFSKVCFLLSKISFPFTRDFDLGWVLHWREIFDKTSQGKINTWDYQWFYTSFKYRKISVFPAVNLIENMGFNENATHTTVNDLNISSLNSNEIRFPLLLLNKEFNINYDHQELNIKKNWAYYRKLSLLFHVKHSIKVLIKGKQF